MSSNITVELFRISPDSKYLSCIFTCPYTYYLSDLEIQVDWLNKGEWKTASYKIDEALFNVKTRERKHREILIPLEKLFPVGATMEPAIYSGKLTATYYGNKCVPIISKPGYSYIKNKFGFYEYTDASIELFTEITDAVFVEGDTVLDHKYIDADGVEHAIGDQTQEIYYVSEDRIVYSIGNVIKTKLEEVDCNCPSISNISANMICSDVNMVYQYILEDILTCHDKCNPLPDNTILKYLMLYGHLASLFKGDLETAKEYFKELVNAFDTCGGGHHCHGSSYYSGRAANVKSCNCKK